MIRFVDEGFSLRRILIMHSSLSSLELDIRNNKAAKLTYLLTLHSMILNGRDGIDGIRRHIQVVFTALSNAEHRLEDMIFEGLWRGGPWLERTHAIS